MKELGILVDKDDQVRVKPVMWSWSSQWRDLPMCAVRCCWILHR